MPQSISFTPESVYRTIDVKAAFYTPEPCYLLIAIFGFAADATDKPADKLLLDYMMARWLWCLHKMWDIDRGRGNIYKDGSLSLLMLIPSLDPSFCIKSIAESVLFTCSDLKEEKKTIDDEWPFIVV